MASRRFLQAASRLRVGARAASDDARIVERATRGQVEMRQFGIESLGGAGMHAPHVAIFGAGFVGVNTALALLQRNIASRVTLTDVDKEKCLGEVLDLEDAGTPGSILCASPWEAGQADVIVITAGRGQLPGETRLELINGNAKIMKSIIDSMGSDINPDAKIVVVANPCDPLTSVWKSTRCCLRSCVVA